MTDTCSSRTVKRTRKGVKIYRATPESVRAMKRQIRRMKWDRRKAAVIKAIAWILGIDLELYQ